MRTRFAGRAAVLALMALPGTVLANAGAPPRDHADWPQWRGPSRDGHTPGPAWPDRLDGDALQALWRVPLGRSYSGPVVHGDLVYTTETGPGDTERAYALDRTTGEKRWRAEWRGAVRVPFFAKANGDWIRATPACDGERLFVAGMRDLLLCLDARSGRELWRLDFVDRFKAPVPAFGFVSSPLADGDAVYAQAGAAVVKLNKATGDVRWRALVDGGGMNGSAFSSPVIAELAGRRQLLVQTRERLAGVDLADGGELWSQPVPAFRGMNILTPLVVGGDAVFTSSYQNRAWLYRVAPRDAGGFAVAEAWAADAAGYMSTPVVVAGHAYLHLQNQRFTCIDLASGRRTWTSQPFGKYCSLVARGDRILALDERGTLLLLAADPGEFRLLGEREVSESGTWAHLAVAGDELFVRELDALAAYRWGTPAGR